MFILDPQPEIAKFEQAKLQLNQEQQKLLDLQKGERPTIIENIIAQLNQSQAALQLAHQNLKRHQALKKMNIIEKAKLEQIETQYHEAFHKVKAIEAQLSEAKLGARENKIIAQKSAVAAAISLVEQTKWALMQKSINATTDAQVFNTLYETGEFVASGHPVIVLLPLDKVKVIFFVTERFLNKIKIGHNIIVACDSCQNNYQAKVNFISPNPEFTPSIIFSKDSREKLVYRIEASITGVDIVKKLHPGQPIDVITLEK